MKANSEIEPLQRFIRIIRTLTPEETRVTTEFLEMMEARLSK